MSESSPRPIAERYITDSRIANARSIRANLDLNLHEIFTDADFKVVRELGAGVYDAAIVNDFPVDIDLYTAEGAAAWDMYMNTHPDIKVRIDTTAKLVGLHQAQLDQAAVAAEIDAGYSLDAAVERVVDARADEVRSRAIACQAIDIGLRDRQ